MRIRLLLLLPLSLAAACGADAPPPNAPSPLSRAPDTAPADAAPAAIRAADSAMPRVEKRVVVSLSRPSGTNVTTIAADGTITVAYDVLENGRGPHVDATLRLAPDGSITALDARGHHEIGTIIEETFVREGARARWKSREEHGERDAPAGAFFVPISRVPDTLGMLGRALLKAGGTLPLLPTGEAHIERTVETSAHGAAGDRRIVGYVITGLDLTPIHVWMNEDNSWFATVSPWWSVVPEGFEKAIEPLIEQQNDIDRKRDRAIARDCTHQPPSAGIAYTHARVLDVEKGAWLDGRTVLVVGETIRAVGPSAAVKIPTGAEVVDLAGKAVLPGLWDMHSHLSDPDGALDVASGVTTARDVGNDPDKLDDYKKRYDEGTAVGPHVVRFGFIEGRGEKAASSKITAENEAEAKAAVEIYAKRGYDGIKIYNSVKPELVPILAKEAHARGMFVSGHIPVHMLANEAVRAGYDGIEHINMLFLNFLADHDTDTRTPLRFTLVGDKGASLDLKSKPVQDFFALLKQKRTIIDPTVGVFEDLLLAQQGKIIPGLESTVERLPVQTQRLSLRGSLPLEGKEQTYKASFENVLAMLRALHEQKLPLVVGTDSLGGLSLHHELVLYVRAGITPADALRMATIEAARSLKLDSKTGSIAPGKAADFFVIEGDPLAKIEDVENVVWTVRGGRVFASPSLYDALGVRPKGK
jgi:hypothetical protein